MKKFIAKVVHGTKKHSPAIWMGLGLVGLGGTAYLAYKSRSKVEKVVQRIEEDRENEVEINKVEVVKDLTEALYQPILCGMASIACILMAHKIQSDRIKFLMGALVTEQARNVYFQQKYRKEHGEEAYSNFVAPVDKFEKTEIGKNGKEKTTVESVKRDVDRSIGDWYSNSTEYVSDDHSYNISYIDAVVDKLQTLLFQRGTLLLNEVRDALGLERDRNGNLLGWTSGTYFEIEKHIINCGNVEDGESLEQIWLTWSNAKYIFNDVEFNGRYSIL